MFWVKQTLVDLIPQIEHSFCSSRCWASKAKSKVQGKNHQDALSKRLALWKDGEISKLIIRERQIIQSRIGKFKGSNQPDKAKVFAKLVLEGQISAIRFLSETSMVAC